MDKFMKNLKMSIKSIMNRLNNKGTILAMAGAIVLLLNELGGLQINSDRIMNIVNAICSLLIGLGVLNNPVNNNDMYIPAIKDSIVSDEKNKENNYIDENEEIIDD